MNKKNIFIWTGVIFFTFIFLFFIYKLVSPPEKTEFPEINKVKTTDHTRWSKENKNLLIEYSDLQCPACKNFHDILNSYEATGGADTSITNKVTLVFRHFPLTSIHLNSLSASYAAEAAGLQNKFWEMTDALFEKQAEWSSLPNPKDYFITVAKSLKLDTDQFSKDMGSQEVKNKVQADISEGDSIGVNSTPTFFLNGKKLKFNTLNEFKNLLKSL